MVITCAGVISDTNMCRIPDRTFDQKCLRYKELVLVLMFTWPDKIMPHGLMS